MNKDEYTKELNKKLEEVIGQKQALKFIEESGSIVTILKMILWGSIGNYIKQGFKFILKILRFNPYFKWYLIILYCLVIIGILLNLKE